MQNIAWYGVLFACLSSFWSHSSQAQSIDPISCGPGLPQVVDGQLKRIDPETVEGDELVGGPAGFGYEAMGYSSEDRLFYAVVDSNRDTDSTGEELRRGDVIAIDADGETFRIGELSTNHKQYAGEVIGEYLWTMGNPSQDLFRFNLITGETETVEADLFLPSLGDFAAVGSVLYAVKNQTLYRIDTSAEPRLAVTTVAVEELASGTYGAAFSSGNGRLYFAESRGGLYEVFDFDGESPTAAYLRDTDNTVTTDGASCIGGGSGSSQDWDGDGCPNHVEDPNHNGIVDPGETDPLIPDTDGDGVPDCATEAVHNMLFAFEDLKNQPSANTNDFDYNDFVFELDLVETRNYQDDWMLLTFEAEAMARGAAYAHRVYLDLGINGPATASITYLEADGQTVLSEETQEFDGNPPFKIRLFKGDSYDAIAPWLGLDENGDVVEWFANTHRSQSLDEKTSGRVTRISIEVHEPSQNPSIDDNPVTQHIHELEVALIGPRLKVLDTGVTIRHPWRYGNATQDLVTGAIYGATTPLLGMPLDQSIRLPQQTLHPIEHFPIWQAYESFVDYMLSGRSEAISWFSESRADLVWPTTEPEPTNLPERRWSPPFSPTTFAQSPAPITSAAAVADLNGDLMPEVIVGDYQGVNRVYDGQGRELLYLSAPAGNKDSSSSIAVGDIDGDGKPEFLRGYDSGNLYAWNHAGQMVQSWQISGTIKSTPAVTTCSGLPCVFFTGGDRQLHGFKADGSQLPGYPVFLGGEPDNSNAFVLTPSPAVAFFPRIDQEVVVSVGNGGSVFVTSKAGGPMPGWPVDLDAITLASPAVADLNLDGHPEIVVALNDGRMVVLSDQGEILWERRRFLGGPSSPSVGDFDGDGRMEVFVGSVDGALYGWHANGAQVHGFPIYSGGAVQSSPIVLNLDGNGKDEVIWTSFDKTIRGVAYSADHRGVRHLSSLRTAEGMTFPATLDASVFATPIVADIDLNSTPDLLVGTYGRRLHRLELEGSQGGEQWSTFRGSTSNTGQVPAPRFMPVPLFRADFE